MADHSSAPKPSSSVKLVLLGEAAVGKVGRALFLGDTNRHSTFDSLLCHPRLHTLFSRRFPDTTLPLASFCLPPCDRDTLSSHHLS